MGVQPKFHGDIIINDKNGKALRAITRGQQDLLEALDTNDIVFVNGPAGTGKTHVATWYGIDGIDKGEYENLVLTRPIVEAGEELGFLPGTFEEKVAPYMQPLYEAIELVKGKRLTPEMVSHIESNSPPETSKYRKKKIGKGEMQPPPPRPKLKSNDDFYRKVNVCPLAYLRGATKNKSFIILDECFTEDTNIGFSVHGTNRKSKISTIYKKVMSGHKVEVLSFNEDTKVFEYKPVTNVFKKRTANLVHIKFNNGRNPIKCTASHPFAVINTPESDNIIWKMASELTKSDKLVRYTNGHNSTWIYPCGSYDILCGMLLGDGTLARNKSNSSRWRVQWIHGMNQSGYNTFKINLLNGKYRTSLKSGYTNKPLVGGSTSTISLSDDFVACMYRTDGGMHKKHISAGIIDYFTDRTMALWYMDDGSYNNRSGYITLHTESFDDDSIDVLCDVLRNRYDVSPNIYNIQNDKYKIISLNRSDSDIILKRIAEYIHPDLSYKLPFMSNFDESLYTIESIPLYTGCDIIESIDHVSGEYDVYNIEVSDNNNYLVDGLLVHNCQNVTKTQMKMMLTRIGRGSKLVLCGDINQSDLEHKSDSGFRHAQQILKGVKGIGFITLNTDDIVRHRLIKDIIIRYEESDNRHGFNKHENKMFSNREYLDNEYDFDDSDEYENDLESSDTTESEN